MIFATKTFETQGSFAGHRSGHVRRGEITKHQKSNDHTCNVCGMTFSSGSKLGGHKNIHNSSFEDLKQDGSRKHRLQEQPHQCNVCKNMEWCGKKIPLELDHIDGDPENNIRENLRLICPNCHAQTDTYKGKNMGRVQKL